MACPCAKKSPTFGSQLSACRQTCRRRKGRSRFWRGQFRERENLFSRPDVEGHHILVNNLRMFGMGSTVSHQSIDGFVEGYSRAEEFDTDEITLTLVSVGRAKMADARVGNRRLAVERQTDGLDRLDGNWLMRFDQRAVPSQIMNTHGVASVKRSPERSEHLEPHTGPSIAWRSHIYNPSTPATTCASGSPRPRGNSPGENAAARIVIRRKVEARATMFTPGADSKGREWMCRTRADLPTIHPALRSRPVTRPVERPSIVERAAMASPSARRSRPVAG